MDATATQGFDALTGGAGWVGAGLLGLVMSWLLLKHIPQLMADHKEAITRITAAHEAAISRVTEHCEDEMARMLDALRNLKLRGDQ